MKKFTLELSEKDFEALKKFYKIRYYDGGYDLHYETPEGFNYDFPLQARIVKVLSEVAKQARNSKNNKRKAV